MAFTRNSTATNNISSQPNQPVIGPAALKALFDQSDVDQKSYDNTILLPELESTVDGDSGLDNIGMTPIVGLSATTPQQALEELKASQGTLDGQNVKLTGNQTVDGIKTFTSSPIVPTPTTATQTANKDYVDNVAISATIPIGSLTDQYLSNTAGQIKNRVSVLTIDVNFISNDIINTKRKLRMGVRV